MNVVRNLVLAIIFAAVFTGAAVLAQQTPPPAVTPAPTQGAIYYTPGPYGYQATTMYPGGPGDAQLAKEYVKAEKEDAKKDIRKKLAEFLAKQFDQHVQQQQKELDDLEKQIAHLKDVVKKRLAAKNDIIERRIEQLVKDAEGLGWNAPGSPRFPHTHNPFGGTGPVPVTERPPTAPAATPR